MINHTKAELHVMPNCSGVNLQLNAEIKANFLPTLLFVRPRRPNSEWSPVVCSKHDSCHKNVRDESHHWNIGRQTWLSCSVFTSQLRVTVSFHCNFKAFSLTWYVEVWSIYFVSGCNWLVLVVPNRPILKSASLWNKHHFSNGASRFTSTSSECNWTVRQLIVAIALLHCQ